MMEVTARRGSYTAEIFHRNPVGFPVGKVRVADVAVLLQSKCLDERIAAVNAFKKAIYDGLDGATGRSLKTSLSLPWT